MARLGQRFWQYGASPLVATLLCALIFVALYAIAAQNEGWRLDTTATGDYTPLPEIAALLADEEAALEAIAFATPGNANRERIRHYLETLAAASPRFSFEMIDPNAAPLLAEQYNVSADGTVVFVQNRGQAGERFEELFVLNDRDVYAALLQLIYPTEKVAYFVTGHGEPSIDDAGEAGLSLAIEQIEDVGFVARPLDLRVAGGVPEDAAVLLLIAPAQPLEPAEVRALAEYTAVGGSLFVAREVIANEQLARAEADDLASYLAGQWFVSARPDVVVDPEQARFSQTLAFVANQFGDSPIISDDVRAFLMLFDTARSLDFVEHSLIDHTPLVATSAEAWGEVALRSSAPPLFEAEAGDTAGPLIVALSAEERQSGARLVLVGDGSWLINANVYSGGNSIFFSNALNWLARDEQTLALTPRESVPRTLTITAEQTRALQFTAVALNPLLIVLVGAWLWWKRRV